MAVAPKAGDDHITGADSHAAAGTGLQKSQAFPAELSFEVRGQPYVVPRRQAPSKSNVPVGQLGALAECSLG